MSVAVVPDLASRPGLRAKGERFCPECGQSLEVWRPRPAPTATDRLWWPGLLAVVGIYLMIVFGAQAWSAHRPADNAEGPRHLATGAASSGAPTRAIWMLDTSVDLARIDQRVRALAGDRLAMRALTVAAVGLLALLGGLGSIARRSLIAGSRRQVAEKREGASRTRRGPIGDLTFGIWMLSETMVFSFFRLLMVAFAYVVASEVIEGVPPSGDLVVQAIERTAGLILSVLEGL